VLAGLLVTMGNVADRVGRKRLLLIGSVGFGIASAIAAFAPNAAVLIAARALLGVAGATIMPSTLSIIRNVFLHPSDRSRAIAIWAAGATAGGAIGPLVGGFLLEHFWWGSVFLINVPVIALIVILGVMLLPESRNGEAGRIDVISAGLSVLAIVAVVYAIKHAISDGIDVIAGGAVILGLIAGFLFVRRQRRLETPLVDISLAIIGLGTGLAMTLSTDAVVSAAPPERAGAASSISETAYELGVALGIGVLGSLQTALYRSTLVIPQGTSDTVAEAMKDSLANAVSTIGSSNAELLDIVQHAFTHSMQITAGIAAVLLLIAATMAWRLIPSTPTTKVSTHVEH